MDKKHKERVISELKVAGITRYGLAKMESKSLPAIIHPEEHIGGVVYGQSSAGSVMLIATDRRIIYLDRKPFFRSMDELTYDVVSGIKVDRSGLFSSIVLHTRVKDFELRFVNPKCVRIFSKYIESSRLEGGKFNQSTSRYEPSTTENPKISDNNTQAANFLREHNLATFSSVDKNGDVSGAIVYYMVDDGLFVYILTKSSTDKGRNIFAHPQIALTVHETGTLQTLQMQGTATVETNSQIRQSVFDFVVKLRVYRDKKHLPPITKIDAGSYMVIKINPTKMDFNDYSKLPD